MNTNFETIKSEILRRAKEAHACTEQFSRAYKSENMAQLCTVIKDNFRWACNNKVLTVDLLEQYKIEFSEHEIYVNVSVERGFMLCDSATVEAYGNATVEAYDSATVEACDNATVEACDSATVKAYGNATVEAYDSATGKHTATPIVPHIRPLNANSPTMPYIACGQAIPYTTLRMILNSRNNENYNSNNKRAVRPPNCKRRVNRYG